MDGHERLVTLFSFVCAQACKYRKTRKNIFIDYVILVDTKINCGS